MSAEKKLAKKFKNKPFSLQEARKNGVSKYFVKKLLKKDIIYKPTRGIYRFSDADFNLEEQFKTATKICGKPSAICLISALEYYSLTDLLPGKTWVMVPSSKRVQNLHLRIYRTRSPKWNVGIKKHKDFWVTSLERTLIDCLLFKKTVGSSVAITALKESVFQKKVKLHDIIKCAKKMGVLSKIQTYLEVLI